MSNFSIVLTKIMERKGSVNNEVIRHTGINKSTFFKVKSGERKPSGTEMVNKIIDALRLNWEDRRLLTEAYEIDQIGEYRYFGMKAISEFFMSEARHSDILPIVITLPEFRKDENVRIFREKSDVQSVIMGMLHEKSSQIKILETRMSDFYKMAIPLASRANPGTEFLHIFTMDDTDTVGIDRRLYNVNCFRNVMDIMMKTGRYSPRYYYSPVSAIRRSGKQTNFILSDRYLLTYSDDFDSAVLYSDSSLMELYQEIFEEQMTATKIFAETSDMMGLIREQSDFEESDYSEGVVYCFCPGVCLSLMVEDNDELIERYIKDDFPGKKEFVENYRSYRKKFQEALKALGESCHVLSVANAIENFSQTGYINEFPRQYTFAVEKEERAAVLRLWHHKAAAYNTKIIRDRCIPEKSSLSLTVSNRKAVITLMNEEEMTTVQICVNEVGIVGLIYAYLEKLEKESLMTKEEYAKFMDDLIAG